VGSVAVLGGGVAGLSAAQELAERGFNVTVCEARNAYGGKARSMPVPGSGTSGRLDLPAEHGFRFFPGFYRHLPDTMSRIPSGSTTVFSHLTATQEMLIAQSGGRAKLVAPTAPPGSLGDLELAFKFMWDFGTGLGIKPPELIFFFNKLLVLLCSCDERRYQQWDCISWWDYTEAAKKSPAFQKFLATGLTRTLVAAQAKQISARTGGLILCQLLLDMVTPGQHVDRVLDGPTSEVWIDPWIAYLRKLGVTFRDDAALSGIHCDGRRITEVTVHGLKGPERVVADHYVMAMPVERLRNLISDDLRRAEPRLAALPRLVTRWMNGAMFYLRKDVSLVPGHIILIDSEWALTAISQKQFWPNVDLAQRGDGKVKGILSVDISDWTEPGPLTGKVATACTLQEIHDEVWHQITDAIKDTLIKPANVASWFLDPDIQFPNPTGATNLEPLLINTAGSWADRPEAVTRIPNLFLASDFVRTYTDLATMEGANEAARRAVNGILAASGIRGNRCSVWKLREPKLLAPFRALDRLRWQLRLPVRPPVRANQSGQLTATDPVIRGIVGTARFAADRF
jgi:uncharacterized protein with NAD-binding domain and iron-sulfur cluster